MEDENIKKQVRHVAASFNDYDCHAYFFVNEAVTYTVEKIGRNGTVSRHISGQELIEGSLDYAIREYAFLAPQVFEYWGLRTGSDIGEIVYRLIAENILSASPEDRREDFDEPGPELPSRLRDLLSSRR